jgi:hypothetical protein
MNQTSSVPLGWNRQHLENDKSWMHLLTEQEIEELESSLRHVLMLGKTAFELSAADFPLTPVIRNLLDRTVQATQTGFGLCLLRGFPVSRWTKEEMRTLFWCMGLHIGVPRPQGKQSQFVSDVMNTGGTYRGGTGRGYNTNSKLDFHADGSDVVGLMCLHMAKSGGKSLISSSLSAYQALERRRPDLARVLTEPFYFSRQGEHAPEETPYYQASIVGFKNGRFACRHIRNHITGAQITFDDVPRLSALQTEALDLFDALLASEEICYHMDLQQGDFQFLNNHVVLHARTEYEDFPEPERRRHLLRLWISLPEGQPLPDLWKIAYKDTSTHDLRGGFRCMGITPEIRAFEERLCAEHKIACRVYLDRDQITS